MDARAERLNPELLDENVSSMSDEMRKMFSDLLGLDPVEVCASGLCGARRSRLYWPSWSLGDFGDVSVEARPGGPPKVRLMADRPPWQSWAEPGWKPVAGDDICLPTFTRPAVNQGRPYQAVGRHRSSEAALERWASDGWRYPPYIYNLENLMVNEESGELRLPNATEKELVMFMGGTLSQGCLNPTKVKRDPRQYEDLRCGLIGNSFHAGVVAALYRPLLVRQGLIPSNSRLQDLVDRASLRSGHTWGPEAPMTLGPPVLEEEKAYSAPNVTEARVTSSHSLMPPLHHP